MGHFVDMTFLEGKLGRCLLLTFLKWRFLKNLFEIESESGFNSDEIFF